MRGFTFVASWGVLDLRWRSSKRLKPPNRCNKDHLARVNGIAEKTLVKKSLGRMRSLSGAVQK